MLASCTRDCTPSVSHPHCALSLSPDPLHARSLLHGNLLTGTLPPTWGDDQSYRVLKQLTLQDNPLEGSLPPEWGAFSWSLPALDSLNVSNTSLSGTLPPEWGAGLQSLTTL